MLEEAKWYVIHTYSGYENKVADTIKTTVENRQLDNLIEEVIIPTETVTEIADGKEKTYERKLFPCYVLIKMIMNDDSWYVVRNIRGVTGFVGPGSKPIPLKDEEVARFGIVKDTVEFNSFDVGDTVKAISGPLNGFEGKVESIDLANRTAKITVSMMGRESLVDIDLTDIEVAK